MRPHTGHPSRASAFRRRSALHAAPTAHTCGPVGLPHPPPHHGPALDQSTPLRPCADRPRPPAALPGRRPAPAPSDRVRTHAQVSPRRLPPSHASRPTWHRSCCHRPPIHGVATFEIAVPTPSSCLTPRRHCPNNRLVNLPLFPSPPFVAYYPLARGGPIFVCNYLFPPPSRNVAARGSSPTPWSGGQNHLHYKGQLKDVHLQAQIVNMLRLGDKDKASKMLLDFGNHASILRAEDFVYILDYCARTPDPLFVLETWRIMNEKAVHITKMCWTFIMQALSKGGYLKEAFRQLTSLGENDSTRPYLPLYNIFLNGCVKSQNMAHANNCLKLMDGLLIGKSEITYWELLKLAVCQGNISLAHEIWRDFRKYYSPSIISLRKLIWSFVRLGDLQSAYLVLQRMVSMAVQGSDSLRISGEGRFLSSRLDIPIPLIVDLPDGMLNNMGNGFSSPELSGSLVTTKETLGWDVNYVSSRENNTVDVVEGNFQGIETTGMVSCGTRGNIGAIDVDKGCLYMLPFPSTSSSDEIGDEYIAIRNESSAFSSEMMQEKCTRIDVQKDMSSKMTRKILRWSFSDLIHAYAQCRKYCMAEQLFLQMHDLGLEPSPHTFDGFVRAIISEKGLTYAMRVVKGMEKRNLKPNNDTFSALSVGYSEILDLDMAESLLGQISDSSPKYIHPFNAFLAACDIMDQPERAILILAKVKQLNMRPNIRTFELLFALFGNVNAPYEEGNILSHAEVKKRIQALETDMIRYGVQHSFVSLENLIRALGSEGMLMEMLQYLHLAESLFLHPKSYPRTIIYNNVLHSLVEARESHMAIEVFRNMNAGDSPPDAATYNIMIDCCSILRCFKSACALVSMMLRSGYHPQRVTYTTLIKILLANEDFDAALNLLDRSISEGIESDVLLYNTVLLEADKKGRIDIIEYIVERMHQQKIQPDPATCNYVFSAYVNHDFHNMAMEALQVLSMRMISGDESIHLEKRTMFEDLVHSEEPDVELWITDIFKEVDEHLAAALLNLRWCAIAGYSISWSPKESLWSRRLSSCYGSIRWTT